MRSRGHLTRVLCRYAFVEFENEDKAAFVYQARPARRV